MIAWRFGDLAPLAVDRGVDRLVQRRGQQRRQILAARAARGLAIPDLVVSLNLGHLCSCKCVNECYRARQLVAPAKAGAQDRRLKSLAPGHTCDGPKGSKPGARLRGNDGMSGVALISTIPSQPLGNSAGIAAALAAAEYAAYISFRCCFVNLIIVTDMPNSASQNHPVEIRCQSAANHRKPCLISAAGRHRQNGFKILIALGFPRPRQRFSRAKTYFSAVGSPGFGTAARAADPQPRQHAAAGTGRGARKESEAVIKARRRKGLRLRERRMRRVAKVRWRCSRSRRALNTTRGNPFGTLSLGFLTDSGDIPARRKLHGTK